MRNCPLFVLFTLPFLVVSASAQDPQDWYLHPFAGFMQLMQPNTNNQAEGMDLLYGVRGGRRITRAFDLEGGFRFSAADRMAFGLFANKDGTIPELLYLERVIPLKGGNLFVSDLGIKWRLGQKKFAAFLYAGGGSATRTPAVPGNTVILLQILARQQDRNLLWENLSSRRFTEYHLDFGGGGEISVGRRWGIRFELRDRFEPDSFPGGGRHFAEITAGPSFRF